MNKDKRELQEGAEQPKNVVTESQSAGESQPVAEASETSNEATEGAEATATEE